jgi:hypothetical protein
LRRSLPKHCRARLMIGSIALAGEAEAGRCEKIKTFWL